MSEAEVIRGYYEAVVTADFPHSGEIGDDEVRVKAVGREGCHGNSQNLLFLSFAIEDGRLCNVRYECGYCDPTMYVTGELVCELTDGRPVERIAQIDDNDLTRALGGESRRVLRLARTALRLLAEAIE